MKVRVIEGVVWFLRDVRGLFIYDSDIGVVWQIQSGRWLASVTGLYDDTLIDRGTMESAALELMKRLKR